MAHWIRSYSAAYDVGIFHLIRAGQYLPECRAKRRVLELTDAVSLAHERESEMRTGITAALHAFERRRCLNSERNQAGQSDAAILVSAVDRDHLTQSAPELNDRLRVIPLGVPEALFRIPYQPVRPSLCFVGAMWFQPNILACRWFCQHVVPKILRRVRDFRFEIFGEGPSSVLQSLGRIEGVVTHGFVPDLQPRLSGCRASVAPMLSGSGLQTKLVEAMATGIPSLCSPLAAGPLLPWAEDVLRVCPEPDDYVDQFVTLLGSDSLCRELSTAGRAIARRFVHESVVSTQYREVLLNQG